MDGFVVMKFEQDLTLHLVVTVKNSDVASEFILNWLYDENIQHGLELQKIDWRDYNEIEDKLMQLYNLIQPSQPTRSNTDIRVDNLESRVAYLEYTLGDVKKNE